MDLKQLTKEVVVISEDASFREAVDLMMRKDTNSLFVVDGEGKLVGEINVSDLLDGIVPFDVNGDTVEDALGDDAGFAKAIQDAADRPVLDFMNADIHAVKADAPIAEIVGTAIAHQTAHLAVVDHDERPVGVLSRRGLKHILAKYLTAA